MLFFKQKNVAGLDIGTSSIKLIEIEASKGSYKLKNFGIVKLPKETIVNGVIINAETVVQSLRNLAANLKIKNKNVATSISGHPVIIKKITLPQMTEEELENTIEFEVEQYIPFALDEVNLDFQILGVNEEKDDQMNVMLVAAKKAMIDEYTSVIHDAGFQTAIVDIDVFALENMFNVNYPLEEEDKNIALIDIGASVTNINILKNGVSIFTRDIFLGGNQITEEIQKQLSVSYEEAEVLKAGEKIEGINQELLDATTHKSSTSIATEVQRSLDFFASSTYGEIHQIYLSGGGIRTKGLKEILAEKINTPFEYIDPFKSINYDKDIFDPEYIKEISLQSATGVGLALRRIGDV